MAGSDEAPRKHAGETWCEAPIETEPSPIERATAMGTCYRGWLAA